MAAALMNVKLNWETCPPELLWIIYKNLDYRSLKNCITVNRRWNDVAIDYIKFYDLWPKLVLEGMTNMGNTFQRKSRLSWRYIVINSILWSSVVSARIECCAMYEVKNFRSMHIYKDILMVKMENTVMYFNKDFRATRCYETASQDIDWAENDFMRIVMKLPIHRELNTYQLSLYGKTKSDDTGYKSEYRVMDDVLLYKLEDDMCYVVTGRNTVWSHKWNWDNWELQLRGRFYGNTVDTIQALHIYNNKVSMVTKYGTILCEDPESKRFVKEVDYGVHSLNWVLFNMTDVAVSVSIDTPRRRICRRLSSNHIMLECAEMTCATEHGEVLFLGFKDGVIAICRPEKMRVPSRNYNPELYLRLKDVDKNIQYPKVLAIEVFEDKLSHHLFIAVPNKIIHLLFTYPLNITEVLEQ